MSPSDNSLSSIPRTDAAGLATSKHSDAGGAEHPDIAVPETLPPALRQRVDRSLQAFAEALVQAEIHLPAVAGLQKTIEYLFICSEFVAQTCIRHPAVLADLLQSQDLYSIYPVNAYQDRIQTVLSSAGTEQQLGQALRQVRRREMLRIAWRDLAGWAGLEEILTDLSLLAEACINCALSRLHDWQTQELGAPHSQAGVPQSLVVIGMGKLGARELNFSSDIDLIFTYPEEGETQGAVRQISNGEYFTRLGQRLIKTLAAITSEGFVYRVDMRLRPFGESGPLAVSFAAMEEYYQNQGREWERYALIKARVVAGDARQAERLQTSLKPFIYRRYLDFGVFESLRGMKQMIVQETRRKGMTGNIKLGAGGIREVEFIGQVFQLIRGGRDVRLQEPAILRVLELLAAARYLPDYVTADLHAAYVFLRRTENRLQAFNDEQTHSLPVDETQHLRLALAMQFTCREHFEQVLNRHMQRVHSHFEQVFAAPQVETPLPGSDAAHAGLSLLWAGSLEQNEACDILGSLGYEDSSESLRLLTQLRLGHHYRSLSDSGRRRMDVLMPLLIAAAGQTGRANLTLARLVNLVEAIAQRVAYLALLAENPLALSQLVRLCAASPWLSKLLTRHPVLLDELLDSRRLYTPLDKPALADELRQLLLRIPEDDLEQHMDVLRQFRQAQMLRVAAADTAGILPLMVVSDHLTAIAEVVLQQVLDLAWRYLSRRHGAPRQFSEGAVRTSGFAIVAYGKLGGIELGYGSDLDIVFLHDSGGEQQLTSGPKEIDTAVFFARLGQRIVHILNAHTPAGVLYEVDMRLRPSGDSGLLVSSFDSYADYQRNQAWLWEHQALTRARVVAEAGNGRIAGQFGQLRREILARPREAPLLRKEVATMRTRMRTALSRRQPGLFDLKQDAGGIADIEFMVQYSALLWAHAHPELLAWTDTIRILQNLAEAGLLTAADVRILSDAYRAYRSAVHRLALLEQPASVADSEFTEYRAGVVALWRTLIDDQGQEAG